jgi:hypothetical protein
LVTYRQSTEGKCRQLLREFDEAWRAELSVAADMRAFLSDEQSATLRENLKRSLYFRFLMYGFDRSASRMLTEVNVASLRSGLKGRIAWLHAKSGVNLLCPLRMALQGANSLFAQRAWRKLLLREGLEFAYGSD